MDILKFSSSVTNKTAVLTTQVAFINAILRQSKQNVFGIQVQSFKDAIHEIASYHFAKKNEFDFAELNAPYDRIYFQNILLQHIHEFPYYKDHQDLLDEKTVEEVFRIVNIIRSGDSDISTLQKETMDLEDYHRVQEIFSIVALYEQQLEENHYYDEVRLAKIVLDELSTWTYNEMSLLPVTFVEDEMKKFDYIHNEIAKYLITYTNSEIPSVTYPMFMYDFEQNKCHGLPRFLKGFGSDNEVKFVIYDMIQNQIPFGNVSIQYATSALIPTIQAELEHHHIPYYFVNGIPARDNQVIVLLMNIIKWAQNNFEEKYIVDILKHPLWLMNEENGYSPNDLINKISRGSFRYVEDNQIKDIDYHIGYGYDRYHPFLNYVYASLQNNDEPEMTDLLFFTRVMEHLVNIFNDEIRLSQIFDNMLALLRLYGIDQAHSYQMIQSQLIDLQAQYAFTDSNFEFVEILSQIEKDICDFKLSQEESENAIQIESLTKLHVLERPYTYCIGMSAVNMKNSANQSPVLLDEEMKQYVHGGYLPTIDTVGVNRNRDIKYTLSSSTTTQLILVYPSYDTEAQAETNPSIIYGDILALYDSRKDALDHIPVFAYGSPSEKVQAITPQFVQATNIEQGHNLFKDNQHFSASTLEKFADCPRMFDYEINKNLQEIQFVEPQGNIWLNAIEKGNFVHEVLEDYTKLVFNQKEVPPFQLDRFSQVINTITEKYKHAFPLVEEWIMQREWNILFNSLKSYCELLHEEEYTNGWHFLFAEKRFTEAILHSYQDLKVNGIIDRIDYQINHDEKKIYLRTIDYKTGKASVERKRQAGISQQRSVYTSALSQKNLQQDIYRKIIQIENDSSLQDYPLVESGFYYMFISNQEKVDKQLSITNDSMVILNDMDDKPSQYRLKQMIAYCTKEGRYLDRFTIGEMMDQDNQDDSEAHEQVIANLCGAKKKRGTGRKQTEVKCTYCPYIDLCDKARK